MGQVDLRFGQLGKATNHLDVHFRLFLLLSIDCQALELALPQTPKDGHNWVQKTSNWLIPTVSLEPLVTKENVELGKGTLGLASWARQPITSMCISGCFFCFQLSAKLGQSLLNCDDWRKLDWQVDPGFGQLGKATNHFDVHFRLFLLFSVDCHF